jgi:hypothetical protein
MNIKLSAREIIAALFTILLIGGLGGRASADTAVSTCGTLSSPGNYFLTRNLTAAGDCLVIAADNVAIDMKGKTISGNGTGAAIFDGSIQHPFAIIRNGTIRNFGIGIDLDNSGLATISNVDSSKNVSHGIFIDRCCNTLDAITANGNGGTGILIASDDSSLSRILANGNGAGGILITSCCNTLVASTVSNNTGNGVDMDDCCSFVLSSNIQKNTGIGVKLSSDDNGVIRSNTSKNGGDGMEFPNSGENMIVASTSNKNGGAGVDLGARFGVISGVQANKNAADGVDMLCRGSTASLTAKKNKGANLVQTVTSDGPCANVNLNAPGF